MKLQFDAQQQYQLDAVNAVVDLFDGQPLAQCDFELAFQVMDTPLFASTRQTELGIGNGLALTEETLLKNLQRVQERNDVSVDTGLKPAAGWRGGDAESASARLNFSVEMETGTGKTYVYLRTIFELNRKYGFKKFIIVVPSVAIREGVLHSLETMREHFRALYNNVEQEHFVYDAKKVNKLRQFALSNKIQILIINIDAFRKNFTGTDEERKSNVIYKETDRLSGRQPIEFVQATHPIVIIDEPQSVDNTDKAQEAIRALNPLCTLRYSATHKNPYNLVYSLNPVRAFELRLVKQIVVCSTMASNSHNEAYVRLLAVDRKNGIKAKVELDVRVADGVKRKTLTLKNETNLYEISNGRENYRHGFVISEIYGEPGKEYIKFNNGTTVSQGQELGGVRDELWRAQIRKTITRHLDKELSVRGRDIKVLSLFFIDKVANYRSYDPQGHIVTGKFAIVFEEILQECLKQERYCGLFQGVPLGKLHNGYFSRDKKGAFKDTNGTTQADDDAYNLIMRDKERLLSPEEPLRFLFSHSALREGWDNPNVFQICTLNESKSAYKKRQEIGRGLRLPVNAKGERVRDDQLNQLSVIANESYDSFAQALQTEYEEECGVTFGKVPRHAFARLPLWVSEEAAEADTLGHAQSGTIFDALVAAKLLAPDGRILPAFAPAAPGFALSLPAEMAALPPEAQAELRVAVVETVQTYRTERHIRREEEPRKLRLTKQIELDPNFTALWSRISAKTTYRVHYSTAELIRNAAAALQARLETVRPVRIQTTDAALDVRRGGVGTDVVREASETLHYCGSMPDILAHLQRETGLTRSTLVAILKGGRRLAEFPVNPQQFMDGVAAILKTELHRMMIDGVKYERIAGEAYAMMLLRDEEIMSYLHNRLEVKKSIHDAIVYDSEVERQFAEALDKREDIRLFVKLPAWFKIATPIGTYNPDWAIVRDDDASGEPRILYLVRETKGTRQFEKLRTSEAEKIRCGRRHFEALGVDFEVVTAAGEV